MEEIAAILNTANGQQRNLWQFSLSTGMRPSEYMALEWSEVDWSKHQVMVEQAPSHGGASASR